jgi:hypothetical protein
MPRDNRYFNVQQPGSGLDPQQRAREYRQRHREDGWTRNEKQKLKQLERKADRAERLASQPDQTSPMEIVDTLPDPTSEYLGRSLVQRAPGGFRSSVNTAIQLADDSIAWAEMVMEDPPVPIGFAFLRAFPVGTAGSFPTSISNKSTGDLWVMDQGDSKMYLASATGSVLGNIDIIATFGSPGGNLIGGIDVASDNVFWWFYNQGPTSPGNKAYAHNADGTSAGSFATSTISALHATGEFIAVALNAARTVVYLTDPQDNEVERWSNAGTRLGAFGTGTMAKPGGIDVDASGNIWLSDSGQHWVRKYDGSSFAQLFQIGPGLPGSADGQFNSPRGLHADASGRLFVCDSGNHRIQIFDVTTGAFLGKFGSVGAGNTQFNLPYDVTVFGSAGSAVISIADASNRRIVQWSG